MFGLRAETMQFFINEVCGRMLHEQVRCGHGDVITELSGDAQPLTVLEVEDTSPLGAAHRLYQEVRAIQLVYADPEGRFPWQEGHSFPLDEQPLLGRPGNRSEGSDPPRRPGPTTSAAEAGATPSTGRMGTNHRRRSRRRHHRGRRRERSAVGAEGQRLPRRQLGDQHAPRWLGLRHVPGRGQHPLQLRDGDLTRDPLDS